MIKSRRSRSAGHAGRMEECSNAFKIRTGKPSGRPRRRLEDNTRMGFKEILVDINARNWVDLAKDMDYLRVLNAALNLRVP